MSGVGAERPGVAEQDGRELDRRPRRPVRILLVGHQVGDVDAVQGGVGPSGQPGCNPGFGAGLVDVDVDGGEHIEPSASGVVVKP